jgi:DNA-binding GntR family transcriptional regulator
MFVTDVSVTDLLQVHEIRMDLEPLCAGLAAERMTSIELSELRGLVAHRDAAYEASHQASLLRLDRSGHALLARASHNEILQAETLRLFNLSLRIWYLCLDQLRSSDLAEDAFREILEACEAKDRRRAERAMRRHVMSFYESLKEAL